MVKHNKGNTRTALSEKRRQSALCDFFEIICTRSEIFESDRNGLSIVIDLKKDVDVQNTLNYFFKNTDLQKNYNYNMVAIKDKRPVCMGIEAILDGYIQHQIEVITKRSIFDLNKAEERKHIVDGLIKAVSILDDVVHTIRHSKDKQDAKINIQTQFGFTEKQSEAIVTLQLYRLTNTDIVSLEKEKPKSCRCELTE